MSSSALPLTYTVRRPSRDAVVQADVTFAAQFRREFAERYEPLVRYLARLTGDPATAADIAQETFVRLFGRGSMPDQPRAWLVSVAHNLLRNERAQSARRLALLDRHAAEVTPESATQSADASLEAAERRHLVQRALESLPERDRQILLLRYDGFSYREIAQALQLNEGSVGTLLARAKTAFRDALGAREAEASDA
ncbi:MAG: RNA polymerase sigma factor [Gemmatimonadaceae bacterium]